MKRFISAVRLRSSFPVNIVLCQICLYYISRAGGLCRHRSACPPVVSRMFRRPPSHRHTRKSPDLVHGAPAESNDEHVRPKGHSLTSLLRDTKDIPCVISSLRTVFVLRVSTNATPGAGAVPVLQYEAKHSCGVTVHFGSYPRSAQAVFPERPHRATADIVPMYTTVCAPERLMNEHTS